MDNQSAAKELWYYADAANQPVGPLPFAELERLAAAGVIQSETHVIEKDGTEWKKFASIVPPPARAETSPAPADIALSSAAVPAKEKTSAQPGTPPPTVAVTNRKLSPPPPIEFKFSCPHCTQHILVQSHLAGTSGVCPTCGNDLTIPVPPPARAEAKPAPTETAPASTAVPTTEGAADKSKLQSPRQRPWWEGVPTKEAAAGGLTSSAKNPGSFSQTFGRRLRAKDAIRGGAVLFLLVIAIILWHYCRPLLYLAGFLGTWAVAVAWIGLRAKQSAILSIGGGFLVAIFALVLAIELFGGHQETDTGTIALSSSQDKGKTLGISYTQMTDHGMGTFFNLEQGADVNGRKNYIGESHPRGAVLQLIGDKSDLSEAALAVLEPNKNDSIVADYAVYAVAFLANVDSTWTQRVDWFTGVSREFSGRDNWKTSIRRGRNLITVQRVGSVGLTITVKPAD